MHVASRNFVSLAFSRQVANPVRDRTAIMSSSDLVDAASKLLAHIDRLITLLGEAKEDVLVGALKDSLDVNISKLNALVGQPPSRKRCFGPLLTGLLRDNAD